MVFISGPSGLLINTDYYGLLRIKYGYIDYSLIPIEDLIGFNWEPNNTIKSLIRIRK